MNSISPILIGVSGGSGSGKTTFAKRLVHELGDASCVLISQDSYYIDQSHRFKEDGGDVNFDHPDSIDFRLLSHHLRELAEGNSIQIPIYDFSTHKRKSETLHSEAKPFVIIDGTLILSQPEIVNQFDASIFLDIPEAVRYARRLKRDVAERGRTPEGVEKQFLKQVKPMHDQYVQPSGEHATWTVGDDAGKIDALLATVVDWALGPQRERSTDGDYLRVREKIWKTPLKLAIFDLDSTLILNEGIDELARELGIEAAVGAITERAMRGELEFEAAFRERIALLAGLTESMITRAQSRIQIRDGAQELFQTLKSRGTRILIVSGGFKIFAEPVAKTLGADRLIAHDLNIQQFASFKDSPYAGRIISGQTKAQLVTDEMKRFQVHPNGLMIFGDGANDVPMMKLSTRRVSVCGKPVLKALANITLDSGHFRNLNRWLGEK